jgi:hypothetical protein
MSKTALLSLILCLCVSAGADELRVSSKEPVVVVTPPQWKAAKGKAPSDSFPFETYRVVPPASRNAQCLISILAKGRPEFADPQTLKKLLKADSRPYLSSLNEPSKITIKEMKIADGLGFYVNFVDPDLVGKPAKEGSYKTVTPIIVSLGSNYLIKVTILCDAIDGADYRDSLNVVQSIKIKN